MSTDEVETEVGVLYADLEEVFVSAMGGMQKQIHQDNRNAGWWEGMDPNSVKDQVVKLALAMTEIAEAIEGARKDLMDDKLPHRKMVEVEMADTIVRMLDLAGAMNLDIGAALVEKLQYNRQREDHKPENRAKKGGKKV